MTCEDVDGLASILTTLEENCTPPYEEIEHKIDHLDMKMDVMMAKIEQCGGGHEHHSTNSYQSESSGFGFTDFFFTDWN